MSYHFLMYRWRRKKCVKNKPRWSDYITLWLVIIWFQDCLRQNSQDRQQYAPKHSLQVKWLTPFQTTWENTGWFKTKDECRTIYHLLHTYFESGHWWFKVIDFTLTPNTFLGIFGKLLRVGSQASAFTQIRHIHSYLPDKACPSGTKVVSTWPLELGTQRLPK